MLWDLQRVFYYNHKAENHQELSPIKEKGKFQKPKPVIVETKDFSQGQSHTPTARLPY